MKFSDKLRMMGACTDAVVFVGKHGFKWAWDNCKRADWMMWLLAKQIGAKGWPDKPKVVLLACGCARMALKYVPNGEERPRLAIEAAERWAKNPSEENKSSASDAYDAAYAYADYAAADAYAAAADAYAAYAAAYAACAAASQSTGAAADCAACAACAADAAAYRSAHIEMCKLIRSKVKPPKV